MSASAKDQKSNKVVDQIIKFLLENPEHFGHLEYGEVKFELRDSVVYRVYVSDSFLVKGKNDALK